MIWVAKYLLLEFRTNLSEVQSYARKRKHGLSQLSVQSGDNKAIGCSIGVHVGHAKYEEWAYQLEAAYFLDANHFWGELMLKICFMCRWGRVNMSPYTSAIEHPALHTEFLSICCWASQCVLRSFLIQSLARGALYVGILEDKISRIVPILSTSIASMGVIYISYNSPCFSP